MTEGQHQPGQHPTAPESLLPTSCLWPCREEPEGTASFGPATEAELMKRGTQRGRGPRSHRAGETRKGTRRKQVSFPKDDEGSGHTRRWPRELAWEDPRCEMLVEHGGTAELLCTPLGSVCVSDLLAGRVPDNGVSRPSCPQIRPHC